MLFYCYANVAIRPFSEAVHGTFVRKFIFATQFCDALIVYFRLFLNSKPFFHVSLHFVCTFRRCFFFLCLFLHCTRSFAAPSATKNSADGSSEPLRAVPLYGLESYFLALTEPDITQSATPPPRQKKHGSMDRRTEQRGRTSGKALPLAVLSSGFYVSPQHSTDKKEERLRRAALPQFRLCY